MDMNVGALRHISRCHASSLNHQDTKTKDVNLRTMRDWMVHSRGSVLWGTEGMGSGVCAWPTKRVCHTRALEEVLAMRRGCVAYRSPWPFSLAIALALHTSQLAACVSQPAYRIESPLLPRSHQLLYSHPPAAQCTVAAIATQRIRIQTMVT